MTDPIDSVRRSNATQFTERVTAVKRTGRVTREHEEDEFVFEDKIEVSPEAHLQNAPDVIDLSLEMILALVNGELPDEAVRALESFAPLGDLNDVVENCERVRVKGSDFISWEKSQTLGEALAFAAG